VDEAKLIEKLRLIEALFAGAATEGERVAADHARQRILERLRSIEVADPPTEYRFSLGDIWSRRVFVALLRRYGLRPYRYRGQRYTTVMVRVSRRFVDETLWPEFERIDQTLRSYLSEITDRVVSQVINEDLSEAAEIQHGQTLPSPAAPTTSPPTPAATEPSVSASGRGNDGARSESPSGRATSPQARNKQKRKRRRRRGK
jgi:hypothetical protein